MSHFDDPADIEIELYELAAQGKLVRRVSVSATRSADQRRAELLNMVEGQIRAAEELAGKLLPGIEF